MPDSPSIPRSVLPLTAFVVAFVLWFGPTYWPQRGYWLGGGLVLAVAAGVWFARGGHRTLDATGEDLWWFVLTFLGLYFVGLILVPHAAFDPVKAGAIALVATLVGGRVAFPDGVRRVRDRIAGGE